MPSCSPALLSAFIGSATWSAIHSYASICWNSIQCLCFPESSNCFITITIMENVVWYQCSGYSQFALLQFSAIWELYTEVANWAWLAVHCFNLACCAKLLVVESFESNFFIECVSWKNVCECFGLVPKSRNVCTVPILRSYSFIVHALYTEVCT